MNRLTLLMIAIAFVAMSCGKNQYAAKTKATGPDRGSADANKSENSGFGEDRKVIFDAQLTLVVAEPDTASQQVARLAKGFGGYVVRIGNEGATIRIPAASFTPAIQQIGKLGKVTRKVVTGNDVTEEYQDYEIRISNLMKARERYLELLAKAEHVEAALKVERELERINGEVEMLKGKVQRLEHLSAFSTVDVAIEKKVKPGIIGYVGIGVYKAVAWLFVRNS